MANAPRPGSINQASEATNVIRLTLQGQTLDLPKAISLKEKFAVQVSTGRPLDFFWADQDRISETSFSLLWWLARRANGEPRLSFDQHLADWPAELTVADLDIEIIEDDEEPTDDPEGSGPA